MKMSRAGKTRDISSGGVCFFSDYAMDVGSRIRYEVTLAGSNPEVKIRCIGRVLRSRNADSAAPAPYEIAVTMERYEFLKSGGGLESFAASA